MKERNEIELQATVVIDPCEAGVYTVPFRGAKQLYAASETRQAFKLSRTTEVSGVAVGRN